LNLDLDLDLDSCLFFEILDGSVTSDKELFCLLPFDEAARPPLCIGKYRDEVVPVIPDEFRCACLTLVELRFSSSLGSGKWTVETRIEAFAAVKQKKYLLLMLEFKGYKIKNLLELKVPNTPKNQSLVRQINKESSQT